MGFAIFTIGSLLSGLSLTAEELLAFRLVQGVGAAFLFVNSVAIVTDAFAGEGLGKGIGINQVAINAGTITGYTLCRKLLASAVLSNAVISAERESKTSLLALMLCKASSTVSSAVLTPAFIVDCSETIWSFPSFSRRSRSQPKRRAFRFSFSPLSITEA